MMKIFKFNEYQIQNSEQIDSTCSQCCATPKICSEYGYEQGGKVCITASSASSCRSKTLADFGFDEDPKICGFYKSPTYGGIVDGETTATCYFDKDGDGCLNILTCQQMKQPGKSLTECGCKDECENEREGQFSQFPPSDPQSPCGGVFIKGKCGNCEDQEEPDLPKDPGFPPGQGGPPPSPPSPPSPPPPPSPNPPSPPSPPGGPATTCPNGHTLEVDSTEGFDINGGVLTIYNPNNSSSFNINYEYIYGNVFFGLYNNNESILENYTVTQNNITTTTVKVGVISYSSCGLDSNGDLICCPEGWTYVENKCCPPT